MKKASITDFCTSCRAETSYTLQKKVIEKEINHKRYEFEITVAICNQCGAEMDIPGLLDANIKLIDEQYRRLEGLVRMEDIQKMMEIYNIGKAPLSCALGFGEITITRYLMGQMPSKEYSDIIKKALYSPKSMLDFLNKNKDKIGSTAYKKSLKAAEELDELFCVSDKMLLTISYIFEQMTEVTPLALQKLLYFIQGIYMVMFDKPLFEEDCMAWVHGPVYEDVYDIFKDFKYNPIDDNRFAIFRDRFEELNENEKMVINLVINTFGRYSGKVLEEITHKESPWRNARNGYETFELSRTLITKDEISAYFKEVADKYGVDTKDKINKYIDAILAPSSRPGRPSMEIFMQM